MFMAKRNMGMISRTIYGVVGLVGLGSAIWAGANIDTFLSMPLWSIGAFVIADIGALNWGIVSITGDRDKDLFGLLGL